MKTIFIAGTDTHVGKTYCTTLLLNALKQHNKIVVGVKPIASGATWKNSRLENEDAIQLKMASSIQFPYEVHNPIVFSEPIAPHIAAQYGGRSITVQNVVEQLQSVLHIQADVLFLEGAGGLLIPFNERELYSDCIAELNVPIVMVVAMKLGCINHALLTMDAMVNRHLRCLGWIANYTEPETDYTKRVLTDLKNRLPCPHVLTVSHQQNTLTSEQIRFLCAAFQL